MRRTGGGTTCHTHAAKSGLPATPSSSDSLTEKGDLGGLIHRPRVDAWRDLVPSRAAATGLGQVAPSSERTTDVHRGGRRRDSHDGICAGQTSSPIHLTLMHGGGSILEREAIRYISNLKRLQGRHAASVHYY